MLYRGMDRAQLDAAYNNIAAVPLAPNLFADWAARSARFRDQHHGHSRPSPMVMNGFRVKGLTCSLPTTPRRRPWLISTAAIGK